MESKIIKEFGFSNIKQITTEYTNLEVDFKLNDLCILVNDLTQQLGEKTKIMLRALEKKTKQWITLKQLNTGMIEDEYEYIDVDYEYGPDPFVMAGNTKCFEDAFEKAQVTIFEDTGVVKAPSPPPFLQEKKSCFKCGHPSHTTEKCYIDTSKNKCFNCNEYGHLKPACPKKIQCYKCKQYGHYSPECPN